MDEPARPRVFYERRIEAHDPALYAAAGIAKGFEAGRGVDEAMLAAYAEAGFLLVRGLLSTEEVLAARAELEAMAHSDDPDCDMIWYEGALRDHLSLAESADRALEGGEVQRFVNGQETGSLPPLPNALRARFLRKVMGFVAGHAPLAALARHPCLLAVVERLCGGEPRLFQDMALVKPPGGREKPWHQDHAYFNLPLDVAIAGVWIPLGEATPENGCMHVLAGGHRAGPRPHFKRRDWQLCDTEVEEDGRIAVPMRAGDVLFFDGKLPHGTPTNRSRTQRWAVQFHYRPAEAEEVDDAVRLAAFGSDGKGVTC